MNANKSDMPPAQPLKTLAAHKLSTLKVVGKRLKDTYTDASPIQEMSRRLTPAQIALMEGYMDPGQYNWLIKFVASEVVSSVAQTGFNAGHSAFAFAHLGATQVTSFDINEHGYVEEAHDYLVSRFPQTQFDLVLGDSTVTVPSYSEKLAHDLTFVDGGHSEAVATQDLYNLRALAKAGSYVIMDDCGGDLPWQIGPTIAYNKATSDGLIENIEQYRSGNDRWALGRYQ